MSLREIVSRVVAACEKPRSGLWIHEAVEMGVPMVMADADALDVLVRRGFAAEIKASVTRQIRRSTVATGGGSLRPGSNLPEPAQLDLWGLRPAYVLDDDNGHVKRTEDLNLDEFRGLIDCRSRQLRDNRAHFDLLETALQRAMPYWQKRPGLSFGEVVRLVNGAGSPPVFQ